MKKIILGFIMVPVIALSESVNINRCIIKVTPNWSRNSRTYYTDNYVIKASSIGTFLEFKTYIRKSYNTYTYYYSRVYLRRNKVDIRCNGN